MTAAWMPGAVHKPISYRTAAGPFAKAPLGWILHVVVGNGSPWSGFEHAAPGTRRFSHFWVSKAGVIEQYQETGRESWAQESGNSSYWSVETEGFPNEALTSAQIASLAKIHNFLGAPNAIASKPGQKGIGTHYMGGEAWGGHTCPDPIPGAGPRSHQRTAILAAAQQPTEADLPTPRDVWAYEYAGRQALSYLVTADANARQAVALAAALKVEVDAMKSEVDALKAKEGA